MSSVGTMSPSPAAWTDLPSHRAWLDTQFAKLIRFNRNAIRDEGGFHWLAADGEPLVERTPQLFLTARLTHVASIGVLRGIPASQALLDHGMASLTGLFADEVHGGWFSDPDRPDGRKATYDHVHVGLAASSAVAAGHPGAAALVEQVIQVVDTHLYAADERALRESFARDWSDEEAYRGANANMHGTETFLALGDVTGDPRWHERGLAMADRIINVHARGSDWLIPEHFTAGWTPLPDFNKDDPDHPFRPFGATPGHALEWARFLLALDASPFLPTTPWLVEAAAALTDRAVGLWAADSHEGLVYTVDWSGRPVATSRLHWPVCEGIQATAALHQVTGEDRWAAWYRRLWDHAERHFIDDSGAWVNELDPRLHEKSDIWPGRPDVYHSAGALVVPTVPLSPFLTLAVAEAGDRAEPQR